MHDRHRLATLLPAMAMLVLAACADAGPAAGGTGTVSEPSNQVAGSGSPAYPAIISEEDRAGAYAGMSLDRGKSPDVFYSDGWTPAASYDPEQPAMAMPMKNDAYPGITVNLVGIADDKGKSFTKRELDANGIRGYSISVYSSDGNLPPFTFNGIPLLSSLSDVKSVYGEPDYADEDEGIHTLYYSFDGVSLTFRVDDTDKDAPNGLVFVSQTANQY